MALIRQTDLKIHQALCGIACALPWSRGVAKMLSIKSGFELNKAQ